jgi:hypothetical protein
MAAALVKQEAASAGKLRPALTKETEVVISTYVLRDLARLIIDYATPNTALSIAKIDLNREERAENAMLSKQSGIAMNIYRVSMEIFLRSQGIYVAHRFPATHWSSEEDPLECSAIVDTLVSKSLIV